MNDFSYDATWTLTSLLVWNYENIKCLIFVAQSVCMSFQCKLLAILLPIIFNTLKRG
jgi:hypothetical protein